MAENLKTLHAADGTLLSGAYAYNDNENNVGEYGRLYRWQTALDAEISGWHLPSEDEWNMLKASLGSEPGTKLKVGGSSGFNAKLGGYRFYDGSYHMINQTGQFWTSTVDTYDHSWTRVLFSNSTDLQHSGYGIVGAISVRYVID